MAIGGYVLAESMRPGTSLEGLPLTLTKIERFAIRNAGPDQPGVWTTIQFEFPEEAAEQIASTSSEHTFVSCWVQRKGLVTCGGPCYLLPQPQG